MFDIFTSDLQFLTRAEKKAYRERGIGQATKDANRIYYSEEGNTFAAIKTQLPSATPRYCAMVRSIIVNGSVDYEG